MNKTSKPFWKSKTLWLNTLVAIMAMAESQFALLQGTLEPTHYVLFLSLLAGANMFLRTITHHRVRLKNDDA